MSINHTDKTVELIGVLRANPIFATLDDAALAPLVAGGRFITVAPGEKLVCQDDASDAMYLVVEGTAQILVETSYGPVELASLAAGQLFGEIGAFASIPRTATVVAIDTVRAFRIGREGVIALGRAHPDVLLEVVGLLGRRIATINRAIGYYTQALAALEHPEFDAAILDDLTHPVPELVNFAQTLKRMAEQIVLRRGQRQEMANAAAIQRAMLPGDPPPEIAGRCDVFAFMRPAKEVGGDLYDHFLLDNDRLVIAIGDVSGKGVPAALFMAISRTVLRLTVRESGDFAAAIVRANNLLSADNEQSMFVTMFCAILDLASGDLVYCNCGHNPPALLRADGALEELKGTGPPLGAMPGIAYHTQTVRIEPGDRLFLYTDGVTEATTAEEILFGEQRLHAALRELGEIPSRALVEGVVAVVDRFVTEAPQFDDITALALCYAPNATTKQS